MDKHALLSAVAGAVDRASHVLREHPTQLFQHVCNDLQWKIGEEPGLAGLLETRRRRFSRPWLRLLGRPQSATALVRTFAGHQGSVADLALTADGRRLLSAGADQTLKLWNTADGRLLANLTGSTSSIHGCAITADGRLALSIASGTWDRILTLWDLESGERLGALLNLLDKVVAFTFSPDSRLLAFAGKHGLLVIRDTASGRLVAVLSGHDDHVRDCAFAPDSTSLVSVSNARIKLWDAESGREIWSRTGTRPLLGLLDFTTCDFTPDGKHIVAGAAFGPLVVWDRQRGEERFQLSSSHAAFAFHPLARRILAPADSNSTLMEWDLDTGQQTRELERSRSDRIGSFAYSPDGATIVAGNRDGTLVIWDVSLASGGRFIATPAAHASPVLDCAFTLDGSRILSSGEDGSLCLWDAQTGKKLHRLTGRTLVRRLAKNPLSLCPHGRRRRPHGGRPDFMVREASGKTAETTRAGTINVLAFTPDGRWGALARGDRTIDLVNFRRGWMRKTVRRFAHQGPHQVSALAFSPDGAFLATAELYDGSLRLWNVAAGTPAAALLGAGGELRLSRCAFTNDGGTVVSTGNDETITVWDSSTGRERAAIRVLEGPLTSCAISSDGRRVVSGGEDGTLRVHDVDSGRQLVSWNGHGGPVISCRFVAGGSRVLSADADTSVGLWDAGSGQRVMSIPMPKAAAPKKIGGVTWPIEVATSPDDRYLAVLRPGRYDFDASHRVRDLEIWDLSARQKISSISGAGYLICGCTFTPDGRHIITAGEDRVIRIHDVRSGAEEAQLEGHGAAVLKVLASGDGRYLFSAGADATIRMWDLDAALKGGTGNGPGMFESAHCIVQIGLTPDGRRAVSADDHGTIRVYDGESGARLKTIDGFDLSLWDPDATTRVTTSRHGTVFHLDSGYEILLGEDDSIMVCAPGSHEIRTTAPGSGDRFVLLAGGRRAVRAREVGKNRTVVEILDLRQGSPPRVIASHGDVRWQPGVTPRYDRFRILPDDRHVLVVLANNALLVIDAETGRTAARFEGHADSLSSIQVCANGSRLLTAGWDRALKLWDVGTGRLIAVLETDFWYYRDRYQTGGWVGLWDPQSGELLSGGGGCVTDDTTGRVFTAQESGAIDVWEAETGRKLVSLCGHSRIVQALAILHGGTRAVSAGKDETLRLWDLDRGGLLETLTSEFPAPMGAYALDCTFIGNGRVLLRERDGFRVFDVVQWRDVAVLRTGDRTSPFLFVSPDGRRAVTAERVGDRVEISRMHLWDVDTGVELASWNRLVTGRRLEVEGTSRVRDEHCRFFRGTVVSAHVIVDEIFRLFDRETGERIAELNGYTSIVKGCDYCARTARLMVGDAEGRVLFFALENCNRS